MPAQSTIEAAMRRLRGDLFTMASMAKQNLDRAIEGLLERDADLCNQAVADDEEVDRLEKQIDLEAVRILTLHQPSPMQLREVVCAMKVSSNLERVSDEAGNIARRARKILQNPELPEIRMIEPIYGLAAKLLHDSVRSFSDHNETLAFEVNRDDEKVDASRDHLQALLRRRMEEDVPRLKDYLDLVFMIRSLERIGDHATNIAEDTIFAESARDIRHGAEPRSPA